MVGRFRLTAESFSLSSGHCADPAGKEPGDWTHLFL